MESVIENKEYINLWEKIEDTPFSTILSEEDGMYRIALGRYVICEEIYETKQEARDEAQIITWDKIMNMICAIVDEREKRNKRKQEEQ